MTGTSIFDPVLCEIAYLWFCKPGGIVLDPFAGGSVRGIVASAGGYKYWGSELRGEQVAANNEQAKDLRGHLSHRPVWVTGDSLVNVPEKAPPADFLWSCPPYGDLEVYSDDPADISNKGLDGFTDLYSQIIAASVAKMRPDTFAGWVVGNYRDKAGHMVDLVGISVRAFEQAGAHYYNEAVLLNPPGTAPIRTNTNFHRGARKLVKIHQNVLFFVKGDPKKAAAKLPELSVE